MEKLTEVYLGSCVDLSDLACGASLGFSSGALTESCSVLFFLFLSSAFLAEARGGR